MNAIDLFSGGGGATQGLIDAGFQVVAAIERDSVIAAVHHQNFKKCTINDDVFAIDYRQFAGINHLHASPPCQAFSNARDKSLPDHPDKDAGLAVIKAISECRPITVSLENVQGYRKSPVYQAITRHLWESGYWVIDKVVNFASYGLPQNRKRLIMIASRFGMPQLPIESSYRCGWYDAIADLIPDCPDSELAEWQLKILDQFKPVMEKGFLMDNECRNPSFPSLIDPSFTIMASNKNSITVFAPRCLLPRGGARMQSVRPYLEKEPSPTLRAMAGWGGSHLFDLVDGLVIKKTTPRCLARLQSFPDNYQLPDRTGLAVKIIGNAVPPLAMKAIARSVLLSYDLSIYH